MKITPFKLSAGAMAVLVMTACGHEHRGESGASMDMPATRQLSAHSPADPTTQATYQRKAESVTKAPAHLSRTSISAELLANLIITGTTHHGRMPEFLTQPAYPWSGKGPHGFVKVWELGRVPKVYGGQSLGGHPPQSPIDSTYYNENPDTTPFQYRHGTWFGFDRRAPDIGLKSLDTELTIFFGSKGSYYGDDILREQYDLSLDGQRGEKLLALATTARASIRTGRYDAATQPLKTFELKAERSRDLRFGERIPLNEVVQQWRDANGNLIQLMLLPGKHADEVRLCLNHKLDDIKRLSCTAWRVTGEWPGNRQASQHLGLYVEDASVQPKGSERKRYWQSTSSFPWMPIRPVSTLGVRGDVLARMMTSHVNVRPQYIGPDHQSWSAFPKEGKFPDGPERQDGQIPKVEGWSYFSPRALPEGHAHYLASFLEPVPWNPPSFHFQSIEATIALVPMLGRFYEGKDYYIGSHLFTADGDPYLNQRLLQLGKKLRISVKQKADDESSNRLELLADKPFTIRYGRPVPFNRVIQRWQGTQGQRADLLLLKGSTRDQFRVCLDYQLMTLKRRVCSMWQVPLGWKVDRKLLYKGLFIEENRRPSGENHSLLWWTEPGFKRYPD